jgi:hypothetical protein
MPVCGVGSSSFSVKLPLSITFFAFSLQESEKMCTFAAVQWNGGLAESSSFLIRESINDNKRND